MPTSSSPIAATNTRGGLPTLRQEINRSPSDEGGAHHYPKRRISLLDPRQGPPDRECGDEPECIGEPVLTTLSFAIRPRPGRSGDDTSARWELVSLDWPALGIVPSARAPCQMIAQTLEGELSLGR